ncbi:hypothetical protein [Gluconacetobacter sacchari]|nr:hypothetical protein [Gluconacetobacter sacchari]
MLMVIGILLGLIVAIGVAVLKKWDLWWPVGIMLIVAALTHG